ncbi:hypothetical protein [Novosphingobium sp.]|uniref:hypothetical protein n=1 Tax=Novosphingobium sp. TaxID=1874826 RepID=UPI002733934B|nr:hypothetical protein [Novosphingobium sp.]MDP3906624.1 hypothetical protein [Novosphingobium sp.]
MRAKAIRLDKRGGAAAAMLLAGAVGLLALPSAVLALSNRFEPEPLAPQAEVASGEFMPAEVDPRLSRSISVRALSKGRMFRFTPAATPSRLDRSVTVAVRLDANSARQLMLGAKQGASDAATNGALRIAPTGYSLGSARGYRSFAQSNAAIETREGAIPDLAAFKPSTSTVKGDPARFSPHIALDEREKSGRSPRTFEQNEQTVDVGGRYRLSRNLNVTAGVRYSSSDRDRLLPLTDGRQDNQAVYVGTQFRF